MAKKILLVTMMVLLGITAAWADLVTNVGQLPLGAYTIINFNNLPLATYSTGTSLAITSGTNTVTFTGLNGQFDIENTYAGLYNTTGNYLANSWYVGDPVPNPGPAGGGTATQTIDKNLDTAPAPWYGWYNAGNGFTTLKISFATPVSAFGFNMGALDNIWTFTAYNINNQQIDFQSFGITGPYWDSTTYLGNGLYSGNTGEFYGLKESSKDISYVLMSSTKTMLPIPYNIEYGYTNGGSYDWIAMDNFEVQQGPVVGVPIPGTAVLLGTGLVALVGFRKRLFQ